ncbi:MAG: aminodeoxychorismate/anthranilate synthase component II [Candidatus Alcyoniella australis]|nr:aminodeoxychorismate/anthranilate synthase component II [Candidatus Alcyoniella australis]
MSRPLILIDNYDSFSFNLVQAFGAMGARVVVFRNDRITVGKVLDLDPSRIVISPGPGRPQGAGISMPLIEAAAGRVPLLGVCLGHQCLAQLYGGTIVHAPRMVHGKTVRIEHCGKGLFDGLDQNFTAGCYNSLMVRDAELPAELEVSARCADDTRSIMGLRHLEHPLFGVQFHPESFLTEDGGRLLRNFLEGCW